MQIMLDEEMCQLINAVKWGDWHETYHCAIQRDADGRKQAVLVVTGSLYEHFQQVPEIQIDEWSIGECFAELLSSIAHGFPMETASNRYLLAMLEAIRKHQEDHDNIEWTTWELD